MELWFCDENARRACSSDVEKIIDRSRESSLTDHEKFSGIEEEMVNIYQVLLCVVYLGVPD